MEGKLKHLLRRSYRLHLSQRTVADVAFCVQKKLPPSSLTMGKHSVPHATNLPSSFEICPTIASDIATEAQALAKAMGKDSLTDIRFL